MMITTSLRLRAVVAGLAVLMILSTQGCFRHVNTTSQLSDVAHFRFPNFTRGDLVTVQGPRNYTFTLVASKQASYAVAAGRYQITVTRAGEIQAERDVFIAAGETKDVAK